MTSTDPETLSLASKCFICIPEGKKLDVVMYLLTQLAGSTTDPNTLMTLSKDFQGVPDERKLDIIAYLSCQFA